MAAGPLDLIERSLTFDGPLHQTGSVMHCIRKSCAFVASFLTIACTAQTLAATQSASVQPAKQPTTATPSATALSPARQPTNSRGLFQYNGTDPAYTGTLGWTAPTGDAQYLVALNAAFDVQRRSLESAFRDPRRTVTGLRLAVTLANNALLKADTEYFEGPAAAAARAKAAADAAADKARKAAAVVPKRVVVTPANPAMPLGREIPLNVAVEYSDGSRRNFGIDPKHVALGLPAKLVSFQFISSTSFGPSLKTLMQGSGRICAQVHIDGFSGFDCTTVTVAAPDILELELVGAPLPTTAAAAPVNPKGSTPGTPNAVTPPTTAAISVKLGERFKFEAKARYTDDSVRGLPDVAKPSLSWRAEPATIVQIDPSGVLTCRVGGGKLATIKAFTPYTPPWVLAWLPAGSLPPGLAGTTTVVCR